MGDARDEEGDDCKAHRLSIGPGSGALGWIEWAVVESIVVKWLAAVEKQARRGLRVDETNERPSTRSCVLFQLVLALT